MSFDAEKLGLPSTGPRAFSAVPCVQPEAGVGNSPGQKVMFKTNIEDIIGTTVPSLEDLMVQSRSRSSRSCAW